MVMNLYMQITKDTYQEGNDVKHMQLVYNIKSTQGIKLEDERMLLGMARELE